MRFTQDATHDEREAAAMERKRLRVEHRTWEGHPSRGFSCGVCDVLLADPEDEWEDHYPVARSVARDKKRARKGSRMKGYSRSSMPSIRKDK